MGELARERAARDLWISRGHLWAGAAVVLLLCGLSFIAGVQFGRSQATAVASNKPIAAPPEGDLVELIARVEATSQPGGGVDKLTFPDALVAGEVEVRVPAEGEASTGEEGASAPPPPVDASELLALADPIPDADFSVEVAVVADAQVALNRKAALLEAGHDAWIGVSTVNGALAWRISLGSYASEEAAKVAARAWTEGDAKVYALR